jgi:biotin carboxyl carrier protein
MAWEVTQGDAVRRVEVEDLGDGRWRAVVDGEALELVLRRPEAGLLQVHAGDRVHRVDYAHTDGGVELHVDGHRHDLAVVDERRKALLALSGGAGAGGGEVISTSMPGKVVALLVEEGQAVDAGDGIVVVEAMKMENELKASRPGVVQSIEVSAGDAVEGGAKLVILGPPEE